MARALCEQTTPIGKTKVSSTINSVQLGKDRRIAIGEDFTSLAREYFVVSMHYIKEARPRPLIPTTRQQSPTPPAA